MAMLKRYDLFGQIIAYEASALDEDDTIELFQHLVDSGVVWELQGSYARMAMRLIEDGRVIGPAMVQANV